MKHLFNLSFLLLALLLPATILAHDFEVGGIYYNINGNGAIVTYQGWYETECNEYFGDVTIPPFVTYGGTTYCVIAIDGGAFSFCSGLTSVTIPNSVTTIGHLAFFLCQTLTSVTIGNSVTFIGNGAFEGCVDLTNVNIPNSVTTIGDEAFFGCLSLTSIDIPNSVTTIGSKAFCNIGLMTSLTIPNSVTSIGDGAFSDCSGLISIIVDRNNTVYDSREGCNAIIETASNTLIAGCKNTVILNSITSIGNEAFGGCTGLTRLTIPNTITSIGNEAFRGCSGLTSVTIPNSITFIGDRAFGGCTGLTSITIPNSVTSIGDGAFSDCSGLNDVYSYINNPTNISMGIGVFDLYPNSNNYAERTLHVPVGTVSAYQADTKWSNYFGSIVEMEHEVSIPGDVNGDGKLTIDDVTTLIDMLLTDSTAGNSAADANCDGKVTIDDLTTIIDSLLTGN